jgi:hypothetical protein
MCVPYRYRTNAVQPQERMVQVTIAVFVDSPEGPRAVAKIQPFNIQPPIEQTNGNLAGVMVFVVAIYMICRSGRHA